MTNNNDKFVATAIDMNRGYLNVERLNCDDFDKCNRFPGGVVGNSIIEALEKAKKLDAIRQEELMGQYWSHLKANLKVSGHNILDFRAPFA